MSGKDKDSFHITDLLQASRNPQSRAAMAMGRPFRVAALASVRAALRRNASDKSIGTSQGNVTLPLQAPTGSGKKKFNFVSEKDQIETMDLNSKLKKNSSRNQSASPCDREFRDSHFDDTLNAVTKSGVRERNCTRSSSPPSIPYESYLSNSLWGEAKANGTAHTRLSDTRGRMRSRYQLSSSRILGDAVNHIAYTSLALQFETAFREMYCRYGEQPVPNKERSRICFELLDSLIDRLESYHEYYEIALSLRDELYASVFSKGAHDVEPYFDIVRKLRDENLYLGAEHKRLNELVETQGEHLQQYPLVCSEIEGSKRQLSAEKKLSQEKDKEIDILRSKLTEARREVAYLSEKLHADHQRLSSNFVESQQLELQKMSDECAQLHERTLVLTRENIELRKFVEAMRCDSPTTRN